MKEESIACHNYCCISHFSLTSLYNTDTSYCETILEEYITMKRKYQLLIVPF